MKDVVSIQYFLFGSKATEIYHDQSFDNLLYAIHVDKLFEQGDFKTFAFNQQEQDLDVLLDAADGWGGRATITEEEYKLLNREPIYYLEELISPTGFVRIIISETMAEKIRGWKTSDAVPIYRHYEEEDTEALVEDDELLAGNHDNLVIEVNDIANKFPIINSINNK